MITLFSTAKDFVGHQRVIQLNALESWRALGEDVEILLFGDEDGAAEAADRIGARHLPEVPRSNTGAPLISAMFEIAQEEARHDLLVFANADIIFLEGLREAVRQVADRFPAFLITGRRVDLWVEERLEIRSPGGSWRRGLSARAEREGELHRWTGLDYFAFPRGATGELPEFAVGRPGWDNYLMYRFRDRGIPVVDATDRVTTIHQNHDYGHVEGGELAVQEGSDARRSRELAAGGAQYLDVRDATHRLGEEGLRRALSLRRPVRTVLVELLLRGVEWPLRTARRLVRAFRRIREQRVRGKGR